MLFRSATDDGSRNVSRTITLGDEPLAEAAALATSLREELGA